MVQLKGHETAKDLLSEIADAVDRSGSCFLSDATITRRIHRHRVTIKRAGELLLRFGLVSRIERGTHKGKATVYTLPLIAEAIPQGAQAATLSDAGDRPAGPRIAAPGERRGAAGNDKRPAMARHQLHNGTPDGNPHWAAPSWVGIPGPAWGGGRRAAAAAAPGRRRDQGVAGVGPGRRRLRGRRGRDAPGRLGGRGGDVPPDGLIRPRRGRQAAREAISGTEGDRRRLIEAARGADHLLKLGRPATEAGVRFSAIWKKAMRPHYEPMPGSEAAEQSRRPEPGAGPRRRAADAGRGGEVLALVDAAAESVMGFTAAPPAASRRRRGSDRPATPMTR